MTLTNTKHESPTDIKNTFDHPLLKRAPDIDSMVSYWHKVGVIVTGLKAIRDCREEFLPRFPEEDNDNYNYRLQQTKLTNVYRDVLEGLSNKPFEAEVGLIKSDDKEIPDFLKNFVENVDGAGTNLTAFAHLSFFNAINNAIDWIFVDMPEVVNSGKPLSIADAKAKKLQPYWTHVLAKNVLEVRTRVIGSEPVISYIRLFEPSVLGDEDKVRVFQRDENDVVTFKLYSVNYSAKDKESYVVFEKEGTLSINLIPLIPVITGRRDGTSWKFFPVMQDAVDLQITLYQDESALQYIKGLACYPMLAANGMKPVMGPDGKPLKVAIGPGKVLYGVPDGNGGNGTWSYVEPQANSMEFLKKSIDSTKQDLRELGRQPLTSLSSQLTNTTTAVAAGKSKSAVSAWALALKDSLEMALLVSNMFMKVDYEPEVNVYTGFDNVDGYGTDLAELGAARERRDISQRTYWAELKRRKVLSPEFNEDEEIKLLLEEVPSDGVNDSPAVGDGKTNQGNVNAV